MEEMKSKLDTHVDWAREEFNIQESITGKIAKTIKNLLDENKYVKSELQKI